MAKPCGGTYVEQLGKISSAGVPPAASGRPRPLRAQQTGVADSDTDFDPSNFSFDFGGNEDDAPWRTTRPANTLHRRRQPARCWRYTTAVEGFRAPGAAANTAELLKFLIDRTGYIKQLEEEDTPEAYSRIENLRELVNAAMDSRDRGETLDQFLDHAALVSDADQYDEHAQITLMTLHAAKGLEFPLVVLAGMEEGLFPHSRTLIEPDQIEEERRLCYVGMTRAMDTLILSRARLPPPLRHRYARGQRAVAIPGRSSAAVGRRIGRIAAGVRADATFQPSGHACPAGREPSSYDSERHALLLRRRRPERRLEPRARQAETCYAASELTTQSTTSPSSSPRAERNSSSPSCRSKSRKASADSVPGRRSSTRNTAKAPSIRREGDGEDAKITVQFPRFGLKKLVEKYAQLEKA